MRTPSGTVQILTDAAARAEKQDVAGKSDSRVRKTLKPPAKAAGTPIKMFVRRGALKRFDDLKTKTAHLDVEVVWDRRDDEDRRQQPCLSDSERRVKDRRSSPPFTWDTADFVVVTPKTAATPKPPPKPPRKRR